MEYRTNLLSRYLTRKHRCLILVLTVFAVCVFVIKTAVEVTLNPDVVDAGLDISGRKNSYHRQLMAEPPNINANSNKVGESSPKIMAEDQHVKQFTSRGTLFNEAGFTYKVETYMKSSLVHSFSPSVEKRVQGMFPDPVQQHTYFANAPAFRWHNGELVTILRIWLVKEKYRKNGIWPYNDFHDNYLYIQKFDKYFKPITNGSLLGIPSNKNWQVGDGPLEPRLFSFNDQLYISFNIAILFEGGRGLDATVFWDLKNEQILIPKIKDPPVLPQIPTPDGIPRDKHWVSYTDNGKLYFVHTPDPLRVMQCNLTSTLTCEFVWFEGDRVEFDDFSFHLRGGTPFELYQYPYYISIGHVTLFKKYNDHRKITRYYTTNIVVLSVLPRPRIVFVNDGIELHRDILNSVPILRSDFIEDPFLFPVGLILEDEDTFYLGGHLNDYSSVALRIRGLKRMMSDVISLDEKQAALKGPPPHTVHTFVRQATEHKTGLRFKTTYLDHF